MDVIDLLLDDEYTGNITLYGENGSPVEFIQIAIIPLAGKTYAILKPKEPMEGMAEGEALVFAVEKDENERYLSIVENDGLVKAVFEIYHILLEEQGLTEQ